MISSTVKINLFLVALCVYLSACNNYKKIAYFRDLQDIDKLQSISETAYTELKIKADDILSITIQTIDPLNATSVNQITTMPSVGVSLGTVVAPNAQISGFLVDKDGFIELPMLGKLKLIGLSTIEARELIRNKASEFYKQPSVQVRFANFKVTILGEVAKPAPYILPNEKISVLDALGLAGDLTIFGKRENIMLVRENNGKKDIYRFNLNSSETFKSPAFYLQQNDIIYVEGNKAKAATLNAARTQTFALIGSIMSVLVILFSRI
ncbi:MAG: hypothetical protein EAZ51_02810 [Sphingobacteriales bacterium]|nr:MAG: hypothetical protein EAZ64_05400 [Sphingobacteriales bacterium]TAF82317.1 MAG: hypothetical protein EAZ51_02810 [Sphingobacteriales bacterium]